MRVADSSQPRSSRPKSLRHGDSGRGRQLRRQIALLRALESSRFGLTVQQLLDLLEGECTLRTLYRDLEQLPAAGFPIYSEGGRFYWRRDASPSGALAALRPSEVLTLLVTEDLLPGLGETGFVREHRQLRTRLTAQLTDAGRAWIRDMRSAIRATLPAPAKLRTHSATIDLLEEACAVEQVLQVVYAAPLQDATTRQVEPHLLWFHAGRAYLVAYCRLAQAFRTFAVQRIQKVQLLDESFERRAEFHPEQYTGAGFGVLHGAAQTVVIDFDAEVAHIANEREWHPTADVTALAGGGARLTMHVGGMPEVAAWLAGFGGKARAVAPPSLVECVRALHQAGLQQYASTPDDARR